MRDYKLPNHILRKGCASRNAFIRKKKVLSLDVEESEDAESFERNYQVCFTGHLLNMGMNNLFLFLICVDKRKENSKWYFDINWHKFEKRWADVFQIYPNAIHLNPLQFCPSMPLLGFPVFCWSSSIVLNRYFHILVNSMTIWSVLKLPKIAWPSTFNFGWAVTFGGPKARLPPAPYSKTLLQFD